MLSNNSLTPDQQAAVSHLYEHDATILVAATGVGKTVIALTAIHELIQERELTKVIVACPAKVVTNHVWSAEATRWDHLHGLRVVELEGDARTRDTILKTDAADVIVVSLNNLDWLLNEDHGCDGIVIDELSKAAGKQTRALKTKSKAGMLTWRVGMTATPVSQNFEKIFPMCRILDDGKTFGTNKAKYIAEYFDSDYMGYNLTLKAFADASIMAKVSPLVHLVSDNKLDTLPPLREEVVRFKMPDETREVYDDMKRHMVAGDVEAANEAVKSGKLRQLASGFLYQENRDEEVDVLDTSRQSEVYMWRALHPRGTRVVIFYEFMEQGRALTGMFQNWATSSVPDFIAGKANILLAQIHSLSHGVDGLQHVCADVLFMQPVWSRDAAEQAVGRVWRQGQTKPVTVTTLVCDDTLDDVVMSRVEGNAQWMELFKQHLEGE